MRRAAANPIDFAGFQSEDRVLPPSPMRIVYRGFRYKYFKKRIGDDWLFLIDHRRKAREITNLDPYRIRDEFACIDDDDPDRAVRFLSETGIFWPFEKVRWSQFREWQEYFAWLRIDPDEAEKKPAGKKAWETALTGYGSFFSTTPHEFAQIAPGRIPTESYKAVEEVELTSTMTGFRDLTEGDDAITIRNLRRFPWRVGLSHEPPARAYDPRVDCPPEDWETRRKLKPPKNFKESARYIPIETHCVIEAIGATIYVDHSSETKYAMCKYEHCPKRRLLFKIQSDHGQEFCSDECKWAYSQKERRNRERKQRSEFVKSELDKGRTRKQIEAQAKRRNMYLPRTVWKDFPAGAKS